MNTEPQTPVAPQMTITPQTPVEPQARGPEKHGAFGEVSAERLMAVGAESIPCLWEPMLQQVGIAAVIGNSDTGKSAFLRELTVAVSAGDKEFLGFPLRTRYQRAVSYLLTLQNRLHARPASDFAGLDYLFDTENLIEQLDKLLAAKPADLVVVDTFADIYNGSMNENNRVRAFLQEFNQIAQRRECLVLFLHHTGKRTEDLVPSKHNAIGSQGFEAKMRLVIELRSDQADSSLKHLCIVKGNYLPAEYKQQSYVLHFDEHMNFTNTGGRRDFEQLRRYDSERGAGTAGQGGTGSRASDTRTHFGADRNGNGLPVLVYPMTLELIKISPFLHHYLKRITSP